MVRLATLARHKLQLMPMLVLVGLFFVFWNIYISTQRAPTNSLQIIPDIVVITTFPNLLDKNFNNPGYLHLSRSKKEARMEEYVTCMDKTLNNPRIKEIHILYDQDLLLNIVKQRFQYDRKKEQITFKKIENSRLAMNTFQYAFDNFQNSLVMVTQADIYPGNGFEHIDKNRLKSKNIMYALTRHGKIEDHCDMSNEFCDDGRKYVGSHDSYIFIPKGNFSKVNLTLLDVDVMSWGVDVLIAWIFQNKLGYVVLNPCKVIFVYHLHCSYVRNTGRETVNTANTTGWVVPTSQLE